MKVAIVAEKETSWMPPLVKAMKKEGLDARFVPVGTIALSIRKGIPKVMEREVQFHADGVFLHLPEEFMLFADPFLNDLAKNGVYCQIKPTAFTTIANRPLLYASLSTKKVKIPKTALIGNPERFVDIIEEFSFPVTVEVFEGVTRKQRLLLDSHATLKTFMSSLPKEFDLLAVRELIAHDLEESIVIGKEVFTVRRKWDVESYDHGAAYTRVTLNSDSYENILRAAKVIGTDICLVYSLGGMVTNISGIFDIQKYSELLGIDLNKHIAKLFKEKLK